MLTDELRRMVDARCARLDSPSGRDIDRREHTKRHRRRHEKSRNDCSEGRVFRHVLRILLIIAIMAVIVRFVMLMASNEFDLVMMILKLAENLMRVPNCEEQHNDQCRESIATKAGHQRNQR